MPSFDQNIGAPSVGNQQLNTNSQLLNEGYPGISQPQTGFQPQTSFQPSSDTSTVATAGSANSQLASLPQETLLGTIANLPQQDITAFFTGLPQAEQTQINTFMQQNPNAQGKDVFAQLANLPAADLAQGLSMIPGADLQQALSVARSGTSTDGSATPGGTGYGATGMDNTSTSGTSMHGTDTSALSPSVTTSGSMDTTGGTTYGTTTQPGMDSSAATSYGTTSQPMDTSGGTSSGNTAQPMDTSGTPSGTTSDATGAQPAYNPQGDAATQNGGTAAQNPSTGNATESIKQADPALLKALSILKPADLNTIVDRLPDQDITAIYRTLPAADQQSVQQALANNQNPTAKDAAAVMEKLPAQDLINAIATSVPTNDLKPLLADSMKDGLKAPSPGGSEFPLLFGLAATGGAGYVAYRRGLFAKAPDLLQKLTGNFDEHAPSWMKFGRGAGGTDGAVVDAAAGGVPETLGTEAKIASTIGGESAASIAEGAANLDKAAAIVEKGGQLSKGLEIALDVAKVIPE